MNAQSPIARAMLDMALLNEHLESVLRIGDGPQTLSLELTNMTDRDMTFVGHGTGQTELHINFRPGTLDKPENVTASGDGWSGKMTKAEVFHTLVLTRSGKHPVNKGETHSIQIKNLIPSASGGSRATRVEVAYQGLQIDDEGPVDGRRIVHLSVLHPSVGPGQIAGAIAKSGPLEAEIINSSEVVWKAGAAGTVDIKLSSNAPFPVVPQMIGGTPDMGVSRLTVSSPKLNADVVGLYGYIGTKDDTNHTRWTPAGNTITYNSGDAHVLNKRFMGLELTVTSNAVPGIYPLYIDYENFGDENTGLRRGRLTLLFSVVSVGASADSRDAETSAGLTVNGPLVVKKSISANALAVTHTGTFGSLNVTGTAKTGPLQVSGDVAAKTLTVSGATKLGDLTVSGESKAHRFRVGKHWDLAWGGAGSYNYMTYSHLGATQFRMRYHKAKKFSEFHSDADMILTSHTGKTGINVVKPEEALHVKGNVKAEALHLPLGWRIYVSKMPSGSTYLKFMYGNKTMMSLSSSGDSTNRNGKWSSGIWNDG